jgi:MoxR-like ATPase
LSEILNRTTAGVEAAIEPAMNAGQIIEYQKLVQRAQIAPHVQDYAVRVALATHPKGRESDGRYATPMVQKYVRVGASPRAAQALVLSGKCQALLDGRAAVSVEDIRKFAMAALRHRIILNFEAEADGVTTDAVIENILSTLPTRAD